MSRSSATHVIRLRGPWECEIVAELADPPARELLNEKIELGSDFRRLVRFRRRFGLPTGLEPDDQIDLVIERVDASGHVRLNQALLGEIVAGEKAARFSLRGRLQPRNLLLIEFVSPGGSEEPGLPLAGREETLGGLAGEVRLEILSHSA